MCSLPVINAIFDDYTIKHRGSNSSWERTVKLPAIGKFVEESHYCTTEDDFRNGRLFAVSKDELMDRHLARSLKLYQTYDSSVSEESIYNHSWNREWTPPEGGEWGQGSVGDVKPSPEEELWLITMMWAPNTKPKIGTKFLLSANGRHVVVVAGYETGPGSEEYLGGVTCEVHSWLQTNNSSQIEVAYLKNQDVPLGPVALSKSPGKQYRVTANFLNVREQPTLSGNIIGVLKQGDVLPNAEKISDTQRVWLKVTTENLKGWASMNYLEAIEIVPELFQVTASRLNVRDEPSLTGTIIGQLSEGEIVQLLDDSNLDWLTIHQIQRGLIGFASSKYLTSMSNPKLDYTLDKPDGYDLEQSISTIEFFKHSLPPSVKQLASQKLTTAQSKQYFLQGIRRICITANQPSSKTSDFEKAIKEGRVVDPPCATCNSQVMKYAAKLADLPEVATFWSDPNDFWPTHNNEALMRSMGFNYFLYDEFIAPVGAVGVWTRYKFYGIPGHAGHIFMIFQDGGENAANVLVGDNTRKSNERHGHFYRPSQGGGSCVGFWLPNGIYPFRR